MSTKVVRGRKVKQGTVATAETTRKVLKDILKIVNESEIPDMMSYYDQFFVEPTEAEKRKIKENARKAKKALEKIEKLYGDVEGLIEDIKYLLDKLEKDPGNIPAGTNLIRIRDALVNKVYFS